MANKKSDVTAKQAFCNELLSKRGFQQAKETASPTDITAVKDGITWYYEIKMTKRKSAYFGAATSTEWEQAFRDPEHYRFVIAITDDNEQEFRYLEELGDYGEEYDSIIDIWPEYEEWRDRLEEIDDEKDF